MEIKEYEMTGILQGRRYRYSTSDYIYAVQKYQANNLQTLWAIYTDGKRKALFKRKDETIR